MIVYNKLIKILKERNITFTELRIRLKLGTTINYAIT